MRGKKCESIQCNNILGLDGTNIVTEHLLPQGKFPEFKTHPKNVAFVCGCINLDDFKPMVRRIQEIERHFPSKVGWVRKGLRNEKQTDI